MGSPGALGEDAHTWNMFQGYAISLRIWASLRMWALFDTADTAFPPSPTHVCASPPLPAPGPKWQPTVDTMGTV